MKAGDLVKINASSHFEFSAKYGLLVSPPPKTKKLTKWIGSPWEVWIAEGYYHVWEDDFEVMVHE